MPPVTGPPINTSNPECRRLDRRRRELRADRQRWFERLRTTRDPDERDNILHTIEGLDNSLQMLEEQLHEEGCYRSPVPPGMLLQIDGVELTQSIQYYALEGSGAGSNNAVPLVAIKPLLLRTYLRWLPKESATVDGRVQLMEFNPNTLRYDILRRPLAPEATLAMDGESSSTRRELNRTLNFLVPAAECHGRLQAVITAWVPGHGDDAAWRSVDYRQEFEFNTRRTPIVHCFRVAVTRTIPGAPTPMLLGAPSEAQCRRTMDLAARMLPLPGIEYRERGEHAFAGALEVQADYDAVRDDIATVRNVTTPTPAAHEIFVAMIAWHNNAAGIVWGNALNGSIESIADNDDMFAHELSHLLLPGDDHVADPNCALAALMTDVDTNYPDYPNAIQRAGIGEWGVDVQATPRRLHSPERPELMSYCGGDHWISPYNYARAFSGPLLDPFRQRTVRAAATDASVADKTDLHKLIVSLRLHRSGQADLRWALHVPGEVPRYPDKGHSGYTLELHDRSGRLLSTQACQRSLHRLPTAPWDDVQVVMPWLDDAAALVLVGPAGEVARWPVAARQAPRQRRGMRISRAARSSGGEELRLEWEPHDVAPAFQMLRYTPDDGRTWIPLASGFAGNTLTIDAEFLRGAEGARFELVISSGIRTERLPFEDAAQLPRSETGLRIHSPAEGQSVPRSAPLRLLGSVDAMHHGAAFHGDAWWTSQRDGFLGDGLELLLPGRRLSSGRHVLRLTLRDTARNECQASVAIEVRAAP